MREMKDSGIEWVGTIPAHWSTMPNKYVMRKIKVINPTYNGENILSLTVNGVIVRDLEAGGKMPSSFDGYQILYKGNLLMCLFDYDVTPRCIGLIKDSGVSSPAYSQFVLQRGNDAAYFYYYYLMVDHTKALLHRAKNLRHSFTEEQLGAIKVPVPPIAEQERIADFLDSQCSQIDAISADIQKEIERLEQYKRSVITEAVTKGLNPDAETKKSTIFYMAPYNSEWHLSKIGYECTKLARPFSPADMPLLCTNKGKVSPRPSDMTGKMVSEDNAMQGIHKGDIAIHGMDTWHGAIAMSEYDGKITRVVHVCDSKQDKRFIVYYLQQLAFNDVYKLISFGIRGNTSDFRSWDKVKDIYIALPDIDEQQKISDFLDLECRRVEDIVSEKKKQLDVLDAYKKSLIYEYVTGKKEVPAQN